MTSPQPTDLAHEPRPRNARGDGERLREQLIEAAVALLSSEGDAARLSVRAIAKGAGVSPTALYLHFPDRDALVSAAVDRGFAAFNHTILSAAAPHAEAFARIRAMGLAYLDFTVREPALYAVLFSTRRPMERPAPAPGAEPPAVRRDEALEALIAAVAEADAHASAPAARDRALALWAGLHGYAALRAQTPWKWPEPPDYAERLLTAHLPGAA